MNYNFLIINTFQKFNVLHYNFKIMKVIECIITMFYINNCYLLLRMYLYLCLDNETLPRQN